MMEVLVYLLEYYPDAVCDISPYSEYIRGKLENMGFESQEIEHALMWLEGLEVLQTDSYQQQSPQRLAFRVLTTPEKQKLDIAAQGFLQTLQKTGMIGIKCHELIVDRAMAVTEQSVNLSQIKWISLIVLLNQTDHEQGLAWVEQTILAEMNQKLH